MLKAVQKAIRERDRSLEPKYSRKKQHVSLIDPQNREVLHRVSLGELDNRDRPNFPSIPTGPGERNGC